MARVLIGIVGYCQFVRGYALGPDLMARLLAGPWPESVEVKDLNWGPIAIVQDMQAAAQRHDRVVLVGAVDRGLQPGTVTCRRWQGRVEDVLAVQRRVFEAVTGVISVENLLVIGAHFGVWPKQLFTVEVQLPESCLGDLVLAELEAVQASAVPRVIGEQPLTRANLELVERLVESSRRVALGDADAMLQPLSLDAAQLSSVAQVCHYDFEVGGRPHRPAAGREHVQ